jgi:hypothetical protein
VPCEPLRRSRCARQCVDAVLYLLARCVLLVDPMSQPCAIAIFASTAHSMPLKVVEDVERFAVGLVRHRPLLRRLDQVVAFPFLRLVERCLKINGAPALHSAMVASHATELLFSVFPLSPLRCCLTALLDAYADSHAHAQPPHSCGWARPT